MKNSLLKKLYAAISASIYFTVTVQAQIIYTDVKPDVKFTCSKACSYQYDLDLNNDGVIDFRLSLSRGLFGCGNHSFSNIYITALDSNSVVTGADTSDAGKLS